MQKLSLEAGGDLLPFAGLCVCRSYFAHFVLHIFACDVPRRAVVFVFVCRANAAIMSRRRVMFRFASLQLQLKMRVIVGDVAQARH